MSKETDAIESDVELAAEELAVELALLADDLFLSCKTAKMTTKARMATTSPMIPEKDRVSDGFDKRSTGDR